MAKKVVATLKTGTGKNFTKCIKMVKSDKTGAYMFKEGIIDPTKVTRSALQNATSVASTLLTTESCVANIKEDTPAMPAGGGAGMGMM